MTAATAETGDRPPMPDNEIDDTWTLSSALRHVVGEDRGAQAAAATAVGVRPSTFSRWFHGAQIPDWDPALRLRLAALLGVPHQLVSQLIVNQKTELWLRRHQETL